jgi:hypothetical protein
MAPPKGFRPPNAGKGRQRGSKNKATANAREAIARFVDGNVPRLQAWLDAIEQKEGPRAAWTCLMDLIEYHVPKLARTELTGQDGGPIEYRPPIVHLHPGERP